MIWAVDFFLFGISIFSDEWRRNIGFRIREKIFYTPSSSFGIICMKLSVLFENQKLRHSNARHLDFSRLETIKKFHMDVLITHGSKSIWSNKLWNFFVSVSARYVGQQLSVAKTDDNCVSFSFKSPIIKIIQERPGLESSDFFQQCIPGVIIKKGNRQSPLRFCLQPFRLIGLPNAQCACIVLMYA